MNEIKVFLVEDEMVIRRGIKNSIDWEKEGYIFCGEASDGELAYPMIIKEKPDILITDIRMPFMDGLELCKLVKKELPNIKILILSGYDEFDYAKEAIRLGVTEYLLKPISSGKLLETTNYTNVKAELDARNTRTFVICIWISVAAIVLALFLTMKAAKSVTKPIQKLCRMTQQVAEGDFTVQTKESNTDEIAVLTRSFNDMTQEIGGLVEDIKQQQKNLRIAETKLLQAQINPHFLYNTLDAIVWLAEENRKDEVVSMVTALSDFFRTTLSKGRDFITVREERSHIESYLKIQQFRYQDIMSYEIDMEENMGEFMIPKLTLQPLVENALYHGLKNKRGGGMIKITGRLDGENMIFTVTDDGKGMTKEVLEKLQESIGKEKGDKSIDGFGIGNVNRRIRYYYGERYGVTLESVENDGTKATVTMAAQKNQPFS